MLIIFIDAYPFTRVDELADGIGQPLARRALKPGFGYSVNLHNELFAGLGPDRIGYFGEWNFRRFPRKATPATSLLTVLDRFPTAFRIWRLFLNKILRKRKFYIPARFSGSFERKGIYPFVMRGKIDNVLERHDFEFCVADAVRAPLGKKDAVALRDAFQAIDAGRANILVSLCDLDGLFHEYGCTSQEVADRISWLSRNVNQMAARYLERHPDGDIVILSDHGIRDVDRKIRLDLTRFQKEVDAGQLVYFFDSLYLAVWATEPRLAEQFADHVVGKYGVLRLTSEERAANELSSARFGDAIFLCPEGASFSPNHFGFRTLKSYHGYHPECADSKGILLTSFPADGVNENKQVHGLLETRLASARGKPPEDSTNRPPPRAAQAQGAAGA